jgi:hypothetical protein
MSVKFCVQLAFCPSVLVPQVPDLPSLDSKLTLGEIGVSPCGSIEADER